MESLQYYDWKPVEYYDRIAISVPGYCYITHNSCCGRKIKHGVIPMSDSTYITLPYHVREYDRQMLFMVFMKKMSEEIKISDQRNKLSLKGGISEFIVSALGGDEVIAKRFVEFDNVFTFNRSCYRDYGETLGSSYRSSIDIVNDICDNLNNTDIHLDVFKKVNELNNIFPHGIPVRDGYLHINSCISQDKLHQIRNILGEKVYYYPNPIDRDIYIVCLLSSLLESAR
jgi:hypothetical protein